MLKHNVKDELKSSYEILDFIFFPSFSLEFSKFQSKSNNHLRVTTTVIYPPETKLG